MGYEARTGFLAIVSENQVVKQYILPHQMPRFLNALDNELKQYDSINWETNRDKQFLVRRAMSKILCEFNFPRAQLGKAVELCMNEFIWKTKKISKITGKVMSDSLEASIETMKKQLPDILIPDFVKFMYKLDPHPPISEKYEAGWQKKGVWYSSQKEHVMRWLQRQMTHGGETSYHRDKLNISARTSYNHWNNPGMALWLLASLGEKEEAIIAAGEEASNEENKRRRSGIVRKHFPFERVLELLNRNPQGKKIIIRTVEELEERAKPYRG